MSRNLKRVEDPWMDKNVWQEVLVIVFGVRKVRWWHRARQGDRKESQNHTGHQTSASTHSPEIEQTKNHEGGTKNPVLTNQD